MRSLRASKGFCLEHYKNCLLIFDFLNALMIGFAWLTSFPISSKVDRYYFNRNKSVSLLSFSTACSFRIV